MMSETETHQEVVKVWIEPGCIVCDSCETDSPLVFEVLEETCIVRSEATKTDFTKPLTPSIIVAAEGCPVDVIKFETIEVAGPEPWAGQEETEAGVLAAAGAAAGGGKPAVAIPEGPPNPKWAGLLSTSHTSGSRSAGGPEVRVRPAAKATVELIGSALPPDASPDVLAAAMVGAGYIRPKSSVAERIRQDALTRRSAVAVVAGIGAVMATAWGLLVATAAVWAGALQSFMVPRLTKEPPSSFRAGKVSDYPSNGVYTQFKGSNQVWIIRKDSKIFALSTICTHLGCIPNWWPNDNKFKCPCHGSGFYMSGVNFEGPAPRPLERLKISLDGEFILVDKSTKFRSELGQWGLPGSELLV